MQHSLLKAVHSTIMPTNYYKIIITHTKAECKTMPNKAPAKAAQPTPASQVTFLISSITPHP
jgi:hypothetical protein